MAVPIKYRNRAVLSPGENFAETGIAIRRRSPFVHTLICGDVNGLFGNIFTDEDISRGGYAIDSYFEILAFDGFRLPPEGVRLTDLECNLIRQALNRCRGSLREAARLLGISYKTLQYRIRKHGLEEKGQT